MQRIFIYQLKIHKNDPLNAQVRCAFAAVSYAELGGRGGEHDDPEQAPEDVEDEEGGHELNLNQDQYGSLARLCYELERSQDV